MYMCICCSEAFGEILVQKYVICQRKCFLSPMLYLWVFIVVCMYVYQCIDCVSVYGIYMYVEIIFVL